MRCKDELCSDCQDSQGEKCARCLGDNGLSQDTGCHPPNALSLEYIKLKRSTSSITLKFNQALAKNENIQEQLQVRLTENGQEVDFDVLSIKHHSTIRQKLEIFLEFNQPLKDAQLIIQPSIKLSRFNEIQPIITSEYSIESGKQTFKFDPDIRLSHINVAQRDKNFEYSLVQIGRAAYTASQTVIVGLFLLKLWVAIAVIKLLQFAEFFNLLSLEYPANLISFLNIFSGDILDFIPNFFGNMHLNDHYVRTCEPDGNMAEEDLGCSFLENGGGFISFILVLIWLKSLIILIQLPFKLKSWDNSPKNKFEDFQKDSLSSQRNIINSHSNVDQERIPERPPTRNKCVKMVYKISGYLSFCQFVLLMKMAQVDFMIHIAINFYFLRKFTKISIANWVVSIGVLLSYVTLLSYGLVVLYGVNSSLQGKISSQDTETLQKSEEKKVERFKQWMGTRENFKSNLVSPYKYLPELRSLGEALCCFFLVFGYTHFLVQVLPIIALKSFLLYCHFKNKHLYTDKSEHTINLGNEILVLSVSVVFLIYYWIDDLISPQIRYNIFGNVMILILILMMLFNLIYGVKTIIISIKDLYVRIKKGRMKAIQSAKSQKSIIFAQDSRSKVPIFQRNVPNSDREKIKIKVNSSESLKNQVKVHKLKIKRAQKKTRANRQMKLKQSSPVNKKMLSKQSFLSGIQSVSRQSYKKVNGEENDLGNQKKFKNSKIELLLAKENYQSQARTQANLKIQSRINIKGPSRKIVIKPTKNQKRLLSTENTLKNSDSKEFNIIKRSIYTSNNSNFPKKLLESPQNTVYNDGSIDKWVENEVLIPPRQQNNSNILDF